MKYASVIILITFVSINIVVGQSETLTLSTSASPTAGSILGQIITRNTAYGTFDIPAIKIEPDPSWGGGSYHTKISFYTMTGSTGTSYFERMRITKDGYVGIGTTTPTSLLHIRSTANSDNVLRVDVASGSKKSILGLANNGTDYGQLYFDNSNNNLVLYQKYASGDLLLGTNSITNLIIKNGGNIGIGTITPGYKLTLAGSGNILGVDNASTFVAKNSNGTYESFFWPRWSDNVMYMNYGSGGFNIRNNSSTTTMFMNNDGNIGIGTTNPTQGRLVVDKSGTSDLAIYAISDATAITGVSNEGNGAGVFGDGGSGGTGLKGSVYDSGIAVLGDAQSGGGFAGVFVNGNVLINKTSQINTTYKLDVAGTIRANEVVVNTDGADFVFAENYNLTSLSELEQFIKINKHLPEISSAQEMQKEGVSVGELQAKLLQKIEELTMYMIKLDKENTELKNKIEILSSK